MHGNLWRMAQTGNVMFVTLFKPSKPYRLCTLSLIMVP